MRIVFSNDFESCRWWGIFDRTSGSMHQLGGEPQPLHSYEDNCFHNPAKGSQAYLLTNAFHGRIVVVGVVNGEWRVTGVRNGWRNTVLFGRK